MSIDLSEWALEMAQLQPTSLSHGWADFWMGRGGFDLEINQTKQQDAYGKVR